MILEATCQSSVSWWVWKNCVTGRGRIRPLLIRTTPAWSPTKINREVLFNTDYCFRCWDFWILVPSEKLEKPQNRKVLFFYKNDSTIIRVTLPSLEPRSVSRRFVRMDVLSGRRFVRTALDVLSGRRFVRTTLDVLSGRTCLRRFVRTA